MPEYPIVTQTLHVDDSLLLRYPGSLLQLNDEVVMIEDVANADHFFHAISLKTGKHLYSFGRHGKGPGEIMFPTRLQLRNGNLYTFDGDRNNILVFKTDSLRSDRLNVPDQIIAYDESAIPVNAFAALSDGSFLTLNMDGTSRLNRIDEQGKLTDRLFEFPSQASSSDPLIDRGLKGLWSSIIRYDSTSNQLIAATMLGDVIDFYDLGEQPSAPAVQYIGADGVPQMASIGGKTSVAGKVKGFVELITDGRYLYALYSGFDLKRIYEKKEHAPAGGSSIKVFDLQSKKHLCNLQLDRSVNGLSMDHSHNSMLATDANGEDILCMFTLPDFE